MDGGPAGVELLPDLQNAAMADLHREQSQDQAENEDEEINVKIIMLWSRKALLVSVARRCHKSRNTFVPDMFMS